MKKVFLNLLFCCVLFILVACNQKNDKLEVIFTVNEPIKIEIDEYNASYDFRDSVSATRNGEAIDYAKLKIEPKQSTISLGKCEFQVSYKEDDKQFNRIFHVEFVDEYSTITINQLSSKYERKVLNGTSLENLNFESFYDDYQVKGLYKDQEYKKEISMSSKIEEDMVLYAKSEYQPQITKNPVDPTLVVTELDSFIDSLMENSPSYIPYWNVEGFKGRWNYIDGVFLNSIVHLYNETRHVKYKDFFIKYVNYYINEDGQFINPETKEATGFRAGELDSICASKILFDAYELTNDSRYLKAIDHSYEALMSMPKASGSPNFWHKTNYPNQIWLDGMYMYAPFYARYAKANGMTDVFHTIKEQYEYIRNHMFDEEKKLYYHGHDTTKSIFWADQQTGNSANFWLRSSGWLIVSLVDVMEYFPNGEDKDYLKHLLNEAIEGILQYQDSKSGMFYQIIDKGPIVYEVPYEYLNAVNNQQYGYGSATVSNYLESSGSTMIAYALMKSTRLGYIDAKYEGVGEEIFEAIYDHSYHNRTLSDICITAGLGPDSNPYRDGTIAYYLAERVGSNDAKGVGPFLMTYLEYANQKKLLKTYHTITQVMPNGSRELSFLDGTTFKDVWYHIIPGYIFKGFYYDEEFKYPISSDAVINQDMIVYLKYDSEQPTYEQLKNSSFILLDDDFDSYQLEDSLPEFNAWGTKGIYYYINDKNNPGIDLSLNHIQLGDGTAYLYDNSEFDGTQLVLDSGNITSGIVKGHLDVSLEYAGNQWTFFQIYGDRANGVFGEVFGARFEDGVLKYRINGGETIFSPYDPFYPSLKSFSIDYTFNLTDQYLSVWINDRPFILELPIENSSSSFGGIKIVSSDGFVKLFDEAGQIIDYVHRRARVDNVIMVLEE